MKEELKFSKNTLSDIINWLKMGFILCIHSYNKKLYYYFKETLEEINDVSIIYVNVSKMSSLLEAGEWSWYIENEGFVKYKSTHILPTNENNIYIFSL